MIVKSGPSVYPIFHHDIYKVDCKDPLVSKRNRYDINIQLSTSLQWFCRFNGSHTLHPNCRSRKKTGTFSSIHILQKAVSCNTSQSSFGAMLCPAKLFADFTFSHCRELPRTQYLFSSLKCNKKSAINLLILTKCALWILFDKKPFSGNQQWNIYQLEVSKPWYLELSSGRLFKRPCLVYGIYFNWYPTTYTF